MSLLTEINEKRKEIKTDGYPMSVGEWISLYGSNEIDIHPEFQRFFRWTEQQKTNLIESILLGIPLPPIFVSQRPDGVWDVVDGLQRLSTIYHFLGILKNEEGKVLPPLCLMETKYLPSLKGVMWEHPSKKVLSLPDEARLIIKRSKIAASIILRESDETAKYDLFQRLNTGGSQLSPQEVRNCILVMLNRKMFLWLKKLADYQPFRTCVALSDRPIDEAYDLELVLRFILLAFIEVQKLSKVGDIGVFLTDNMRVIAGDPSFKRSQFEQIFKRTFDLLDDTVGSTAFKRYDKAKKKHEGGFLVSQFEVVALGLAFNLNKSVDSTKIATQIKSIWSNSSYTMWTRSGITATRRLPHLIPLGRKLFAE